MPGTAVFIDVPAGGPRVLLLRPELVEAPDERDLRAVWARSANDVYAVGKGVLHWDGCRWSSLRDDGDYHSVWGTQGALWVGGNVDAACECCSCVGHVLHFDGVTWRELPTVSAVVSVWASGPEDVWAGVLAAPASADLLPMPAVLRWNGDAWAYVMEPSSPSYTLYQLLGFDGSEVYLGGGSGVRRWDGSSFVSLDVRDQCSPGRGLAGKSLWFGRCRVASGAVAVTEFAGHWGVSPEDVWGVGPGGRVERFNGTGVLAVESGTERDLTAVWGTSATDVWVVGSRGTILHFAP